MFEGKNIFLFLSFFFSSAVAVFVQQARNTKLPAEREQRLRRSSLRLNFWLLSERSQSNRSIRLFVKTKICLTSIFIQIIFRFSSYKIFLRFPRNSVEYQTFNKPRIVSVVAGRVANHVRLTGGWNTPEICIPGISRISAT